MEAYDRLLAEDFVFEPWNSEDFTWSPEGTWPRAEEMTMISNMLDRAYVNGYVEGAELIEADHETLSTHANSDGTVTLNTHAILAVIWDPESGARADVHLAFRIASGEDGYLRVQRIDESMFRSAEETSWGAIKALYH